MPADGRCLLPGQAHTHVGGALWHNCTNACLRRALAQLVCFLREHRKQVLWLPQE